MPAPTLTGRHLLALGGLVLVMMLPETLPVPVLRGLVVERFAIGDGLAALFMAANMVGALLAAPLVALQAERTGARRALAVLLLLADAVLMQAMAHPQGYASFLLLRTLEGAAHIGALTLLMSLVTDAAGERHGRALGCLGAGLTLGVATGAAIGGVLGKQDPLRTLHAASALLLIACLLAWWLLPPDRPTRHRPGLRELWSLVQQERGMLAPLCVAFVERFTVGFFTTGFPLMLASVHDLPRPQVGMLLAAFLYPFALLSWPFGRMAESWSRPRLVAIGCAVYGVGVMLVGAATLAQLWLLMPLLGIASAMMFTPSLLWLLDRTGSVGRTSAIAGFHAAGALGFLVGPLCCGQLLALGGTGEGGYGYVLAFAVAGLTALASARLAARAAVQGRAGAAGWPVEPA